MSRVTCDEVNEFLRRDFSGTANTCEEVGDGWAVAVFRPTELSLRFGGYYRLGGLFVKLIGNPQVMRIATKHGMPHPTLMRFVLKLLANLTDPRGGDAMDRIINGLTKVAPAV